MRLSQLLCKWWLSQQSLADPEIGDLVLDSRQVQPGDLFCALAAKAELRTTHIQQALAARATCVLVDTQHLKHAKEQTRQDNRLIGIPDLADELPTLAQIRYGAPKISLFAVTGTNGKTSVAWMGAELLCRLGLRCGYVGTLGARLETQQWHTGHTTPDIFTLYRLLGLMQAAGAKACFIETSSHALAQKRVAGLHFHIGVFTNLTRDHLDYHGTMRKYQAAKWELWKHCTNIIANSDDPHSAQLPHHIPRINYGSKTTQSLLPDLLLTEYTSSTHGLAWAMKHQGKTWKFRAAVAGRLMLDNLLAIHACALELGYQNKDIAGAIGQITPPPGRIEIVHQKPDVIIDYAHTPDALKTLLTSLREICTDKQRLAVVFGCGGNRDKDKRPLMGKIAAQLADKVFVTSDNPRDEPPQAIANAILTGTGQRSPNKPVCEIDRKKAIATALHWCKPEDCLAIAGKGHETTQEIQGKKFPCHDASIVRQYFARECRQHAG